jgi:phosphatidylserine/phosphatidylglycerophosphate/cardiolipin synthase-like enzyme
VSGFNIMTPGYYDTGAHLLGPSVGYYSGHSWHDTGLLLQGDAVALVEAEFDRRWSKQGQPPAPSSDTYVKAASWMIGDESCLDATGVCGASPSLPPTPYQDRRLTSAPVPVQVAITSNERLVVSDIPPGYHAVLTGVHQIRDQLVSAITAATSYVYLENYAFHDVAIIQALAGRVAATAPGFVVIAALTCPTVSEAAQLWSVTLGEHELNRYSCAALTLSSRDWTLAAIDSGRTFTPADGATVLFDRRGIEYTTVAFGGAAPATVNIRAIKSLGLTTGTRSVLFCSPARYFAVTLPDTGNQLPNQRAGFRRVYVHSKLALVDDKVAMIGSANLARRSMLQDGELSAFVADQPTVTAISQRLFGHWNMTTPAAWQASMTAFAATTAASLGILPLPLESLPRYAPTWAWWVMTSMFDPSQFL